MKKILLIILALTTLSGFSQQNNYSHQISEFKIDAAKLTIGGILEATYEHVGYDSSGYGVSVLINPRENDAYFEKFSVTPFYRMYFLRRADYGAKGMFVEGFSKFSFGTEDDYFINNYQNEDYFDAAIGLSLGKKWVNRNGFVLEIFAGGGRTLGFSEASPEGLFRGGIFIGKRF